MGMSGQGHGPICFTPGKGPCTHWMGGRVGLRDGLDIETRGKILHLSGNRTSVVEYGLISNQKK